MNNFLDSITKKEINQDVYDEFWKFITERQNVWYKRFVLKEDPPWTDDEYIKNYKYTNIYPELDRGSKYIQDKIKDCDNKNKVFRILVYRLFNRIPSFDLIDKYVYLDKFDPEKISTILEEYKEKGNPVTTDAFMVTGGGVSKWKKNHTKIRILAFDSVNDDIFKNFDDYYDRLVNTKSLEDKHKIISSFRCYGPFLSYLSLFDMIQAGVFDNSLNEWCNPGPGCKKALRLMFSDIKENEMLDKIRYLVDVQDDEFKRLKLDFKYLNGKRLTLADIEWSLCEYQKYLAIKYGKFHAKIRHFKCISKNNMYDGD